MPWAFGPSEWTTYTAAYPVVYLLRGGMTVPTETVPTETVPSETLPTETLSPSARRVVLVDSKDNRRQLMRLVVSGNDTQVVLVGEADSEVTALTVVEHEHADVVVLDVQMPVSDGLATIAALRARYAQLAIVVCSFDLDPATVQQVLEAGADRCLAKPVNRSDIENALVDLPHPEPWTNPSALAVPARTA